MNGLAKIEADFPDHVLDVKPGHVGLMLDHETPVLDHEEILHSQLDGENGADEGQSPPGTHHDGDHVPIERLFHERGKPAFQKGFVDAFLDMNRQHQEDPDEAAQEKNDPTEDDGNRIIFHDRNNLVHEAPFGIPRGNSLEISSFYS